MSGPVAPFAKHSALSYIQASFFAYHPDMYPADFGTHYKSLPVKLTTGSVIFVNVSTYVSKLKPAAHTECNAFLRAARKWTSTESSPYFPNAHGWLYENVERVVGVFAGKGLPEEISLVCSLAVASGFKSATTVGAWAYKHIGIDCCGFTSAYFIALGTFGKPVGNIPSYKSIGGVATRLADITYDNCILFADMKAGVAKIRQNPGNSSHIMVIECWCDYGDTFYVAQAASSKGGVSYDLLYKVIKPPTIHDKDKAIWTLRRLDGWKNFTAVITKRMASYAAGA